MYYHIQSPLVVRRELARFWCAELRGRKKCDWFSSMWIIRFSSSTRSYGREGRPGVRYRTRSQCARPTSTADRTACRKHRQTAKQLAAPFVAEFDRQWTDQASRLHSQQCALLWSTIIDHIQIFDGEQLNRRFRPHAHIHYAPDDKINTATSSARSRIMQMHQNVWDELHKQSSFRIGFHSRIESWIDAENKYRTRPPLPTKRRAYRNCACVIALQMLHRKCTQSK